MAVVLPGKFIYLATPATGSVATANALSKLEGAFVATDRRRTVGHHATIDQVRQLCADQLTGTEVLISGVRNPYDALATWYVRHENHFQVRAFEREHGRPPRISEFLEIWLEIDMFPYLRGGRLFYHSLGPGFVVRQENLQADLDTALRRIPNGPGSVRVGRENATPDKDHWTTYYSDTDYVVVNERLQGDFVKFGYSFVWSNDQLV